MKQRGAAVGHTNVQQDHSFYVLGIPRPQGSMTPIVSKSTGRVFMKHSAPLAEWRNAVVTRVAELLGEELLTPYPEGPVQLEVTFFLPRPKSHPKRRIATDEGVVYKAPDLDKLVRGVGDALEISGLVGSDAQIARTVMSKVYAADRETTGARIAVTRMSGGYLVGDEYR